MCAVFTFGKYKITVCQRVLRGTKTLFWASFASFWSNSLATASGGPLYSGLSLSLSVSLPICLSCLIFLQGGHNSLKSLNLLEKFQSPWISLKLLEKLKKWPFLLESSLKIFLYSRYFPLIKIFNKVSNILMHFQLRVSENVSRAEKVYEVKFMNWHQKQNANKTSNFYNFEFHDMRGYQTSGI